MKINPNPIIFVLFCALNVFAGRESGGGSYVVIDGKVTIADPYYAGRSVKQINKIIRISYQDFPSEIRQYLQQTADLFGQIDLLGFDRFFNEYVKNQGQRYFLVPADRENNVPCERYLPKLNRPVDDHFQFGCTFGDDTYLFVDKWMKAPIEEQALALLHERLWSWQPEADQKDIARFVTGTQTFVQRYVKQALNGDREDIPAEEIQSLAKFFEAAEELRFGVRAPYQVISGGGIVYGKNIRALNIENSFIGIGSAIFLPEKSSSIKIKDSVLLSTKLNASYKQELKHEIIGSEIKMTTLTTSDGGNSIVQSNIKYSYISGDVKVNQSRFDQVFIESQLVGEALKFSNSSVKNSSFRVGRTEVNYSDIDSIDALAEIISQGSRDARVRLANSSLPSVNLEPGSVIENFVGGPTVGVNYDYPIYMKQGSALRHVRLVTPDSSMFRKKTFTFQVEAKTEVGNGTIVLTDRCVGSKSSFVFGSAKHPSTMDLRGSEVELVASGLNCSARYNR